MKRSQIFFPCIFLKRTSSRIILSDNFGINTRVLRLLCFYWCNLVCFSKIYSCSFVSICTRNRFTNRTKNPVRIFSQSQKLMVSTVHINAVGLGADILYQTYFVCLEETSHSTVIEYGKSQGTTENGDVYLTMIDGDDHLFVRFYSFGNGEQPLDVVDAHVISRHLTKSSCRGDTVLDKQTKMCVQHCHELCDPTQGNPWQRTHLSQ